MGLTDDVCISHQANRDKKFVFVNEAGSLAARQHGGKLSLKSVSKYQWLSGVVTLPFQSS